MRVHPIFLAIEKGDIEEVRREISSGASLDLRVSLLDDHGAFFEEITPLMVACMVPGDRAGIVRLLLDSGADPFAVSAGEVTALWYAAGAGIWHKPLSQVAEPYDFNSVHPGDYADRLQLLLDAGGFADETASNGRSALCEACTIGDPERVRMLLNAGASSWPDSEAVEKSNASSAEMTDGLVEKALNDLPIGRGMQKKVHEAMLNLVQRNPSQGESFQIPLHSAAEGGSAECIRLILATGFPVGQTDSSSRTALFYASTEASANALLEAGIDPTHRDHYGNSALEAAFEDERREVAITLLKVSGDFERRQSGWTRLHTAAFRLQPFAVQVLIEGGADPFALTKDGQNALHLAAWQGDSSWDDDRNENIRKTIRLLVRAGLDPNLKSAAGLSPLHDAAHGDWGSVPAIEELLSLGANPNTGGKTPLMEAAEHGESGCIRALLAGGADPQAKDRTGRTALAYARQHLRIWQGIVKGKRLFRRAIQDYEQSALDSAQECVDLLEKER